MPYAELEHKAAGHSGTLADGALVFKPLSEQELAWYRAVGQPEDTANSDEEDSGDVPLWRWMPVFLGTLDEGISQGADSIAAAGQAGATLLTTGETPAELGETPAVPQPGESTPTAQRYLVLENLTAGFRCPNVLDVKLGSVLTDSAAPPEKQARLAEVSRSTTSGPLGFRVCGMRIAPNARALACPAEQREPQGDYLLLNKHYGRARTPADVAGAFETYFSHPRLAPARRAQLQERFFQRLQLFYNTLLDSEVRLISASLLFVFEGDPSRWDERDDDDPLMPEELNGGESDDEDEDDDSAAIHEAPLSRLALIDFAHSTVTPGQGYDENVLNGVESLMDVFEKMDMASLLDPE